MSDSVLKMEAEFSDWISSSSDVMLLQQLVQARQVLDDEVAQDPLVCLDTQQGGAEVGGREQVLDDDTHHPEGVFLLQEQQEAGSHHAGALAVADLRVEPGQRSEHPAQARDPDAALAGEAGVAGHGAEQVLLDLLGSHGVVVGAVLHELAVGQLGAPLLLQGPREPHPQLRPHAVGDAGQHQGAELLGAGQGDGNLVPGEVAHVVVVRELEVGLPAQPLRGVVQQPARPGVAVFLVHAETELIIADAWLLHCLFLLCVLGQDLLGPHAGSQG